jgi:hypothetical protein
MNEVDKRLCLVLIQKIHEVDAMDLGRVREYIKEILAILGESE